MITALRQLLLGSVAFSIQCLMDTAGLSPGGVVYQTN